MSPNSAMKTHKEVTPRSLKKRTAEFHTLEREQRFINPPKDKLSEDQYPLLKEAIAPHVDSFNCMTEQENDPSKGLLNLSLKDIGTKVIYANDNKLTLSIEQVSINKPMQSHSSDAHSASEIIFPAEARQKLGSYKGNLMLKLKWDVNDSEDTFTEVRQCGGLPVMLQSNRCHLSGLSPYELTQKREESDELGGYFIINGIEKLIRMLIVQRRNHPMALIRPSFANRGNSYSQFGVQIRSCRPDQTSQTNVLHYLNDGNVNLRFSWRKNEYLVPIVLILKALSDSNSDKQIFDGICGTSELNNSFLTDRLELLLRGFKKRYPNLHNRTQILQYLGDKFRVVFQADEKMSDYQVGEMVLNRIILVHLNNWESDDFDINESDLKSNEDKSKMIFFMIRKLYSLVAGDCSPDNPDATQHQEILLGGFLYSMIIKEKMEEYLNNIKLQIQQDLQRSGIPVNFKSTKYMQRVLMRVNENIGAKLQYFLSTGNLVSQSGLDLQQVSGYTVVAEKINFYRFLAHFRMVHRGSFFAQLKTTTVRKLLPESWGFLCPVHTPDGTPCGLLNHFAHKCKISTKQLNLEFLKNKLYELGVTPIEASSQIGPDFACVQIDGKIIGYTSHKNSLTISNTLRFWKVSGRNNIPLDLEIGYVPPSTKGQYPGLFLFGGHSRMMRPVKYLPLGKEDIVGPFEQVYMNIAVTTPEIVNQVHTHVEFSPTNILSIIANLTPFSDYNQSPRNMYQCQMGKQTMGTPGVGLVHRSDNKLYRLQSGQTPIVKANLYDDYGMDNFPNGTNAVVAVISYTCYDMDDAMIINKSADERGFGYGTMYKVEKIDLAMNRSRGDPITQHFGFGSDEWPQEWLNNIDEDGLPFIGTYVQEGDPVAAFYDEISGKTKVKTYHNSEPAYIEAVNLIGDDNGNSELQSISIKYRVRRTPQIGDKFSSRHGQKGVCSRKWPTVDMPFSETGIQPDVIINPHAFPSRMTIGMFVESLAGKAGCLHGVAQDATPWRFNEQDTPADYFGEQLKAAGYNYHGNEPLYSGATGEELRVDIYIGVVYYQRLRHMVNDKYQVRSTGPVNALTMQPVKGRKRGGGIRIGEMERDAFIGHGTSFLLQDRLLNCSDYTHSSICRDCGSILSTQSSVPRIGAKSTVRCRRCAIKFDDVKSAIRKQKEQNGNDEDELYIDDAHIWEDGQGKKFVGGGNTTTVAIPFVLKYLDSELSAMGIKLQYNVEP